MTGAVLLSSAALLSDRHRLRGHRARAVIERRGCRIVPVPVLDRPAEGLRLDRPILRLYLSTASIAAFELKRTYKRGLVRLTSKPKILTACIFSPSVFLLPIIEHTR